MGTLKLNQELYEAMQPCQTSDEKVTRTIYVKEPTRTQRTITRQPTPHKVRAATTPAVGPQTVAALSEPLLPTDGGDTED